MLAPGKYLYMDYIPNNIRFIIFITFCKSSEKIMKNVFTSRMLLALLLWHLYEHVIRQILNLKHFHRRHIDYIEELDYEKIV